MARATRQPPTVQLWLPLKCVASSYWVTSLLDSLQSRRRWNWTGTEETNQPGMTVTGWSQQRGIVVTQAWGENDPVTETGNHLQSKMTLILWIRFLKLQHIALFSRVSNFTAAMGLNETAQPADPLRHTESRVAVVPTHLPNASLGTGAEHSLLKTKIRTSEAGFFKWIFWESVFAKVTVFAEKKIRGTFIRPPNTNSRSGQARENLIG